jgi:hypothetical protein
MNLVNFRKILVGIEAQARRLCLPSVLLVFLFLTVAASPLTVPEREQLLAQKQTLLQQMMQSPANVDVILTYARVSAQLGDNEGAISALERLLLFKPNMPQIELELGVLYFRLGSFELARSYLEKANADNPPPELKPRINRYLSEIPRLERAQRVTANIEKQVSPIVPASARQDRITGPCDNDTQLNVVFLYGAELTVTGLNGVAETTKTPGFAISIPCAGASPSTPFLVPPGTTGSLLRALNGTPGRNGGAEVTLTAANLAQSGVENTISGDFATSVGQAVNQTSSPTTQTILNINNNTTTTINNTTNNNQGQNNNNQGCVSRSTQNCQ